MVMRLCLQISEGKDATDQAAAAWTSLKELAGTPAEQHASAGYVHALGKLCMVCGSPDPHNPGIFQYAVHNYSSSGRLAGRILHHDP